MKTSIKITAVALMLGFAVQANAQENSDTNTASATVVAPIALTAGVPMAFGNVAVESSRGGTFVLATNGGLTATDGAQLTTNTGTPATFDVTGEGTYSFAVTLPANGEVVLTHSTDATATMSLNDFSENSPGALTGGAASFAVGASLGITGGQLAGLYSGDFTVSVDYN